MFIARWLLLGIVHTESGREDPVYEFVSRLQNDSGRLRKLREAVKQSSWANDAGYSNHRKVERKRVRETHDLR